jgi:hypothetical protein
MKKAIVVSIITIILFYLGGSFYSLSFDISKWAEETRLITLIAMFTFGLSFGGITLMSENDL